MNDDRFTVEESAALLRAVYPNYPDLRGMKPVPEVGAFLRGLRTRGLPHSETSGRELLTSHRLKPLRGRHLISLKTAEIQWRTVSLAAFFSRVLASDIAILFGEL